MVDFVRSCYEVDARFYVDQPDRISKMVWSFVDEKTPPMPFEHCFGSRVWEARDGETEGPIGEMDTPRRWSGGISPFPLPVLGEPKNPNFGLCGSERQWVEGSVTSDVVPPTWPNSQVKRCCKRPPELGQGGLAIGRRQGVTCGLCNDLPRTLFVEVTHDVGYPDIFDGVWPVIWNPLQNRYENIVRIPNNMLVSVWWYCGSFVIWNSGVFGGGFANLIRCEPYKAEPFQADAISPIFGIPFGGWRGQVSVEE